jgi:hypothetical protein
VTPGIPATKSTGYSRTIDQIAAGVLQKFSPNYGNSTRFRGFHGLFPGFFAAVCRMVSLCRAGYASIRLA